MASGPITSWEIDGEAVADFIFLGFKITADGDCIHGIIRHLLVRRKVMTNLDSIFKSRDITWSTTLHLTKARWTFVTKVMLAQSVSQPFHVLLLKEMQRYKN